MFRGARQGGHKVVQQILGGQILAVAIALAACFAYFWGANWLLDSVPRHAEQAWTMRRSRASTLAVRG